MSALAIACLQIEPRPAGALLAPFLDAVEGQIREAAATGAQLVVLPELWHVGYLAFEDYMAEAVALDDPLPRRLAALAAELGITLHAGSLVTAGERLHNTSLVFGPDGTLIGCYAKMHVFGYESKEPDLIAGGCELASFPIGGGRAGMAICYDLRFPELFRALVDEVALYVIPATWPAARREHWSALLRARAIEDQAYVIGCNAAGTNHGVAIAGRSAVIDPAGVTVAMAGAAPTTLGAVIDLDVVGVARRGFPALRDRVLPGGVLGRGGQHVANKSEER